MIEPEYYPTIWYCDNGAEGCFVILAYADEWGRVGYLVHGQSTWYPTMESAECNVRPASVRATLNCAMDSMRDIATYRPSVITPIIDRMTEAALDKLAASGHDPWAEEA